MTEDHDVNKPLQQTSLGRNPHDVGNDTSGDENCLTMNTKMGQEPRKIRGNDPQTSESRTRSVADATTLHSDQHTGEVCSRLGSSQEEMKRCVGTSKLAESSRKDKKDNQMVAATPEDEQEEQEETYEELVCLVRQFYVERPINPAAIGYHNIETC